MKFIYKEQQFQTEAAEAVCQVFAGQEASQAEEYLVDQGVGDVDDLFNQSGIGFRNAAVSYNLTDKVVLSHIRELQNKYLIEPSKDLSGRYNLTIEMETGTGKTFTYTKTMFELNKRYGWSKFIVVVPSIAIREGVYKSFQSTEEYFANLYGKKLRYFIYNSKQLSNLNDFASSRDIHVMIINAQAFNARGKDARRINMKLDDFHSRRPIDVIAATHPILIIDEPQSVEGEQTKKKLKEFDPLFTLRYSATPKERYNLIYRLDAMDAYNRKIVKKIAVKGISATGSTATESYVYLESINLSKDAPTATISFDVKQKTGVKKKSRIVRRGDNLYEYSGGLEEYRNNFIVDDIDGRDNSITFLNGLCLHEEEVHGEISETELRRLQIRETIRSHIEKERELYPRGIKVLSLFFLDEVAHYRVYNGAGEAENGEYAKMFEEEYNDIVDHYEAELGEDPAYYAYLSRIPTERTHAGYFSIDKKGKMVNSKVQNRKEQTSDDVDAYDLIMKDKERLLSFKEPVRFLFSHSALREGWDNPNVFQICTLKNSASTTRKRQEVGRGMRLCVDQEGNRIDEARVGSRVQEINKLTIIASESYEAFAKGLQEEIAEAISDRPKVVDQLFFRNQTITLHDGSQHVLTVNEGNAIYNAMVKADYIDDAGHLTETWEKTKASGDVKLPDFLQGESDALIELLAHVYNPASIKPEDGRKNNVLSSIESKKLDSKAFQELWKRINGKSIYKVTFQSSQLVANAINALDKFLQVPPVRYVVSEGEMGEIDSKDSLLAGMAFGETHHDETHTIRLAASKHIKYDLIGKLVTETGLTRKDIVAILKGISQKTFLMFRNNPETFILRAAQIINEQKANAVIEHIEYHALHDTYDTDIFFKDQRRGRLGLDAIKAAKSLYNYVIYDSDNEKKFAEKLDTSDSVVVYVKLPSGFFISTPVGKYNPDWAIAFREGDVKHIYFVAETKGSTLESDLRENEKTKIKCAEEHFRVISHDNIVYSVVDSYQDLIDKVMK